MKDHKYIFKHQDKKITMHWNVLVLFLSFEYPFKEAIFGHQNHNRK